MRFFSTPCNLSSVPDTSHAFGKHGSGCFKAPSKQDSSRNPRAIENILKQILLLLDALKGHLGSIEIYYIMTVWNNLRFNLLVLIITFIVWSGEYVVEFITSLNNVLKNLRETFRISFLFEGWIWFKIE